MTLDRSTSTVSTGSPRAVVPSRFTAASVAHRPYSVSLTMEMTRSAPSCETKSVRCTSHHRCQRCTQLRASLTLASFGMRHGWSAMRAAAAANRRARWTSSGPFTGPMAVTSSESANVSSWPTASRRPAVDFSPRRATARLTTAGRKSMERSAQKRVQNSTAASGELRSSGVPTFIRLPTGASASATRERPRGSSESSSGKTCGSAAPPRRASSRRAAVALSSSLAMLCMAACARSRTLVGRVFRKRGARCAPKASWSSSSGA